MNNRQKRGCLLVLLGLSLVLTAMGLHLVKEQQDALAGENAQVLLQYLDLSRSTPSEPAAPVETVHPEVDKSTGTPDETVPEEPEIPIKTHMGYNMIGTIQIPSLEINLPVLSDWSYALLGLAPSRYSGPAAGANFIVMGHNYNSHFTPLHWIDLGADVVFTDAVGKTYSYQVAEIIRVHKNEEEKLASPYPLSLFTCTDSGQKRIVVRCEKTE